MKLKTVVKTTIFIATGAIFLNLAVGKTVWGSLRSPTAQKAVIGQIKGDTASRVELSRPQTSLETAKIELVSAKVITGEPLKDRRPEIDQIIASLFKDQACLATAVAMAEGYWRNDSLNSNAREYSVGIFQINVKGNFSNIPGATFEEKTEWLKDPTNNSVFAKWKQNRDGNWLAWGAFTDGRYKQYFDWLGCK